MTFESFRDELREVGRTLPANVVVLRSVTSTNRFARQVVDALPPDVAPFPRTYFVAYEQTAGRGRSGREWESGAGRGLYCTLVEPLASRAEAALLPMTVAVALCRAAVAAGARRCRLKWPNDLVVGSRKLGGILIEVTGAKSGPGATAIIGFGLNLGPSAPELEAPGATTLEREGAVGANAAGLLGWVAAELDSLLGERPGAAVVDAYRELLGHRAGEEITWRQGGETIRGRFAGVEDSGRMLLDTAEGRRSVAVGDIIE